MTSASGLFPRLGYMLDVSRDRVPTRATLAWLVDVLATCGYNELQLYIEHTFTYAGHDEVWAEASPLDHDDMRWLDRRCAGAGIDLVANMNGFGHMGRWLAHERYRPLAECPDGFRGLFGRGLTPPTCLAPTRDNASFAVELAREMASVVRNPRIHIGGDEPFELGDGVSAAEVADRGRDAVYLEHLSRIIDPLVADGHEVMFWADLFRRDASLIARIPPGAIGVVWYYEAPSETSWIRHLDAATVERLGLPDDAHTGFEAHVRLFAEADMPFWVAPGTSTWNTVIGRNDNAAANIADAVAVGHANRCPGLLLTDWGDGGHWQPLAVSLPSIVRCGLAARHGSLPSDAEVGPTIDRVAGFTPGTGARIDRLGHVCGRLGIETFNGSPLWATLAGRQPLLFGTPDHDGFREADELVRESIEVFADGGVGGERGDIIAAELAASCRLAHIGLRRLASHQGVHLASGAAVEPGPEEVEAACDAQRQAWLMSSRPGGLEDSLAKVHR